MAEWIFQSTPKYFDLPGALTEAPLHDNGLVFLASQYTADIRPGDTVYLCFGGRKDPGLYAIATVLAPPDRIAADTWQHKYGKEQLPADERSAVPFRVRLHIDRYLKEPIARSDIYNLPELAGHRFVTAHIGTNFPLTPAQAFAVAALVARARADDALRLASNTFAIRPEAERQEV